AVIFSLYFLGLNLVPCEDTVTNSAAAEQSQEIHTADQHSSPATDNCTPICLCHCCHVHVVQHNADDFQPVADLPVSTLIIQRGQSSGEEIPHDHFQPPRV
ncbi:MAG: DUF6660 family protein, partial [Salinimicrobium sp.]